MILYGSRTSPYVRRIRLLLPPEVYELRKVDIFNSKEREQLRLISPILKIPILELEGQMVWDSRVIFNELCRRGFHHPLRLQEENLLTALNDISDSLIQKLLAQRSKVEFPKGSHLEVSHGERVENILQFLVQKVDSGIFSRWDFLAMSLYTLIDWIEFRNLADLTKYPSLKNFKEKNTHQERVQLTDPRF